MDNKILKISLIFLLVLAFTSIPFGEALGQCPMCRMAAETNLQNGGTDGRGLNRGILYMLAMPYILVATLGFIWYRNKKQSENTSEE